MTSAQALISQLNLAPHPEGGWYRETWRDHSQDPSRGHGTSIYYLLEAGQRSHWHRVDACEIWHNYGGDGFALQLWSEGEPAPRTLQLGADLARGQQPQVVIPAGVWQAAAPLGGPHAWALAGCTVAPAFDFAGFALAPPGWEPPGHPTSTPTSEMLVRRVDQDSPLPWPPSQHLGRAALTGNWEWLAEGAGRVEGAFCFGDAAAGLPGHVHGGLAAALCDEAMGWACWMSGYVAPGARVMLDYLGPLRAGDIVALSASLDRVDGRQLYLSAALRVGDEVRVRASGRYVSVRPKDWSAFTGWPGLERFVSPHD